MASELKHNTIKQETQAKKVSKVFPSVPDNILFLDSVQRAHRGQGQGREGRVLGRFHHYRAACGQGGPHLPRDHGAGEIPLDQKREEVSERKDCPLVQRQAGWEVSQQIPVHNCLAELFLHR